MELDPITFEHVLQYTVTQLISSSYPDNVYLSSMIDSFWCVYKYL